MIPFEKIDNSWTLFIDRDGVINEEKKNDYIHTWEEFIFYNGVLESFKIFSKKFKYIIVITNQKGVGKGITKEKDLLYIHTKMQAAIENGGGRIDRIYYCSDIDDDSKNRKPNIGMGLQAINTYKDIDVQKSIMVGNTISDMQFGKNLGAFTVFLPTTRPEVNVKDEKIDTVFNTLLNFAEALL